MAWGILEDKCTEFPPGTINIKDLGSINGVESAGGNTDHLKKKGTVVLQPQPDDSVLDPLNWSTLEKCLHMLALVLAAACTAATGSMITYGLPQVSAQYSVGIDTATSLLLGALIFWTAVVCCITSAIANVYGRRPVYVLTTVVMLVANFVSYMAKSFPVLAASRIVAGMASGPFYVAVAATVADIFFVHQRGIPLGIWTLSMTAGTQIGLTIGAVLIDTKGISAMFGYGAIAWLVLLFAVYFSVLESTYHRASDITLYGSDSNNETVEQGPRLPTASSTGSTLVGSTESATQAPALENNEKSTLETNHVSPPTAQQVSSSQETLSIKRSYRKDLTLFRGRLSKDSLWKSILRPIILVILPANIFSSLIFGIYYSVISSLAVITATLFRQPPYNLTTTQVGLTALPGLGTSVLGSIVAGWLSDFLVVQMSVWNKRSPGLCEPEYRLPLMIVATPLGTATLFAFGHSIEAALPIAYPVVFMALYSLASSFAFQTALVYVVDCYPKDIIVAFSGINLVASAINYAILSFVNGWCVEMGALRLFYVFGGVNAVISLLVIPLYVFGKRIRGAVGRATWTQKLYV